ncbi:MAG: exodeoxyribonuclease VII large subunit [Candidatus Algichlamydia australiensis]|nr:exodeoxyribonuclease VII large subunit [Chlamydiales bacterium]
MSTPLSVTQLTQAIKNRLEPYFANVVVKGEITNYRAQASGHIYFSVKDAGAQLPAVLFRGAAEKLGKKPKPGDEVILHGELNIYPPRGGYQLIVRKLEYAGVGELLMQLHERKKKLESLGYFDKEKKKPLPPFPKVIGVVTSPTGAVIQDIINVLTRRHGGFRLVLVPARVQGKGAAEEIAGAINVLNHLKLCDVMIVGRGGGSLEDLWPFNEACVAEAVHRSEIPVVSAVGHETDFSICDFVADVRAPTPSAAAEIVLGEKQQMIDRLLQMKKQMETHILHQHKSLQLRLEKILSQPLMRDPFALLGIYSQKIDEINFRLDQWAKNTLGQEKIRLNGMQRQLAGFKPSHQVTLHKKEVSRYETALDQCIKTYLEKRRESLRALYLQFKAMHPKNILQKGYCIPFTQKENSIMMNSSSATVGERVRLLFHDGELISTVEEIHAK